MVNSLENYVKSQETKLKDSLSGCMELEEKAIHDFRVTLKKTRTILNFIEYWSYGNYSKTVTYRKLRPIFQRTGRIRKLHIHKNLIPELAEKTELDLEFLVKKVNYHIIRNKPFLQKNLRRFKRLIPKIYRDLKKQIKQSASDKHRVDAAAAFQLSLEKKIQRLLTDEQPDLHRIRRLLKQKVYIFDSFQESELLSFYKEFRAEWKILESSIGKWHDEQVFLNWLIKGLQWKRLNDDQYKTMMRLIAHLRSSTKRMEKQLILSIPRLSLN